MAFLWTPQYWQAESKQGKFFRTTTFKAIKTALQSYHPKPADPRAALTALKAVLDAVSAWRQQKETRKFGVDHDKDFAKTELNLRKEGHLKGIEAFSVRSAVTDRLVRDVAAEIDEWLAVERNAWGMERFSDPRQHDAANFMYLVSAQTETKAIVDYRERTVENPSLMKNAVISASVIKTGDVSLWAPSGFILRAPRKCIGATRNEDMAVQNIVGLMHKLERYRELLRNYLLYGIGGPEELQPSVGMYNIKHNEVMVLGTNFGEETSVAGIFLLVDDVSGTIDGIKPATVWRTLKSYSAGGKAKQEVEGVPCVTNRRLAQYRAVSRDQGLPIVQIKVDDSIQIDPKGLEDLLGAVQLHFKPKSMVIKI